MARSNHEATGDYGRKLGGTRKGAGRPLGRHTVPRKMSEKDRFEALQYEYGKLHKENERLRNQLQIGARFNGTIEEMVEAAARGEYNPNQMQGYMAKVWLDRHPAAAALPATMLDDGEDYGNKIENMLSKLHRVRTEQLDKKVRGWLASGRIDKDFAQEIRAVCRRG
jgi:hypothetical protein